MEPPESPKHFSRLLGQIVKALSFNNSNSETDKTDYETSIKEADNNNARVQTPEEAVECVEHLRFPAASTPPPTNNSQSPAPPIRLLVIRCADSKEKVIFDSNFVTDEGQYLYLPQKQESKWLRTVIDFVFGSVSLKNPETIRFTKLDKEQYGFAIVFNLSTTTCSTNPSPRRVPFHDSSTDSSSSSSGYSSMPHLEDHNHGHSKSLSSSDFSTSSNLSPSHSLPATPAHHQQHLQHVQGSTRYRSSPRLTMGAVLLFSNKVSPPVLEPLFLPLKQFISQTYIKSRPKFATMLKSYSNCLNHDMDNSVNLSRKEIPPNLDVLSLFSLKIFSEFISLLVTNPNSKVVVVSSSKTNGSALALFKICNMINKFKNNYPPSSPTQTTSPVKGTNYMNPELDSGFFSCTTIKSSICDEEEEEDNEDDDDEDDGHHSSSDYNSEAQQTKPKNKFFLGDDEDDEQTEAKLALSEPMKEKLFQHHHHHHQQQRRRSHNNILKLQHVQLDLGPVLIQKEMEEHYYFLNNSHRFSPLQTYQLFNNSSPNYDYIHTVTYEILEINLEKLLLRSINQKASPCHETKENIRTLVSKTRFLTKSITDTEKTLLYFLVNLVEIIK